MIQGDVADVVVGDHGGNIEVSTLGAGDTVVQDIICFQTDIVALLYSDLDIIECLQRSGDHDGFNDLLAVAGDPQFDGNTAIRSTTELNAASRFSTGKGHRNDAGLGCPPGDSCRAGIRSRTQAGAQDAIHRSSLFACGHVSMTVVMRPVVVITHIVHVLEHTIGIHILVEPDIALVGRGIILSKVINVIDGDGIILADAVGGSGPQDHAAGHDRIIGLEYIVQVDGGGDIVLEGHIGQDLADSGSIARGAGNLDDRGVALIEHIAGLHDVQALGGNGGIHDLDQVQGVAQNHLGGAGGQAGEGQLSGLLGGLHGLVDQPLAAVAAPVGPAGSVVGAGAVQVVEVPPGCSVVVIRDFLTDGPFICHVIGCAVYHGQNVLVFAQVGGLVTDHHVHVIEILNGGGGTIFDGDVPHIGAVNAGIAVGQEQGLIAAIGRIFCVAHIGFGVGAVEQVLAVLQSRLAGHLIALGPHSSAARAQRCVGDGCIAQGQGGVGAVLQREGIGSVRRNSDRHALGNALHLGGADAGLMDADVGDQFVQRVAVEVLIAVHALKGVQAHQTSLVNGLTGIDGGRVGLQLVAVEYALIRLKVGIAGCQSGRGSGAAIYEAGVFGDGVRVIGDRCKVVVNVVAPLSADGTPVVQSAGAGIRAIVVYVIVRQSAAPSTSGGGTGVVEDVVVDVVASAAAHVAGNGTVNLNIFRHVENVVIDLAIRAAGDVQNTGQVVLADVVAENAIDGLTTADHETAAAIAGGIVVLVDGSVAVVSVPGLAVAVVDTVIALVVLEDGSLALPGPDASSDHALAVILVRVFLADGRSVNRASHVAGVSRCNVVLDQRLIAVHNGDGVAANVRQVVVMDIDIGGTVGIAFLIGDLSDIVDPCGRIGVAHGNAPAVDIFQHTAGDLHIVIAGNASVSAVGAVADQIDTAVAQMLVVDVALDIVDIQIFQHDVVDGALVLGNTSHAGAVHTVSSAVGLRTEVALVGHGNVADLNVLHIVQQDAGRNIALSDMLRTDRQQRLVGIVILDKLLIPNAALTGGSRDQGLLTFAVGVDDDRLLRRAGTALSAILIETIDVQILILEHRISFQQDRVTRSQGKLIDLVQGFKGGVFAGTIVTVVAVFIRDVVGGTAALGLIGALLCRYRGNRHAAQDHDQNQDRSQNTFFHNLLLSCLYISDAKHQNRPTPPL